MVSIKISRGKFPRPGPGKSALRMLLRLTAVDAIAHFENSSSGLLGQQLNNLQL